MNDSVIIVPPENVPPFNVIDRPTIPEPSILLTFIIGLCILLLIKWRRQFNPRNVPVHMRDLSKSY